MPFYINTYLIRMFITPYKQTRYPNLMLQWNINIFSICDWAKNAGCIKNVMISLFIETMYYIKRQKEVWIDKHPNVHRSILGW